MCVCACEKARIHLCTFFFGIFYQLTFLHYVLQAGVFSSCHVRTEWRLPYTSKRFASVLCALAITFLCICGCLVFFWLGWGSIWSFLYKAKCYFLLMWGNPIQRTTLRRDHTAFKTTVFFFLSQATSVMFPWKWIYEQIPPLFKTTFVSRVVARGVLLCITRVSMDRPCLSTTYDSKLCFWVQQTCSDKTNTSCHWRLTRRNRKTACFCTESLKGNQNEHLMSLEVTRRDRKTVYFCTESLKENRNEHPMSLEVAKRNKKAAYFFIVSLKENWNEHLVIRSCKEE